MGGTDAILITLIQNTLAIAAQTLGILAETFNIFKFYAAEFATDTDS